MTKTPVRMPALLPGLVAVTALVAWRLWPGSPAMPMWLATAAAALIATQIVLQIALRERSACHALRQRVAELDRAAAFERRALDQVREESRRIEQALFVSKERYALALRGATDGLWEWNPAADRLQGSPRWLHMLGRDAASDEAAPMCLADRHALVHPDERSAVRQALQQHLDGKSERFELPHRLMHADGRYRWVLSRATAIRHASGSPYRLIGLDTDITRIKRVETLIDAIAEGTARSSGASFFQSLVMHFARALHIDCAFITECANRPATRARTLAFWRRDGFDANFEYELAGTPCERVYAEGSTCFHPAGVGRLFPREEGYEGYLGLPILARDGGVIGHLAFLHHEPLNDEVLLESVYRIFTARASVEIELAQALQRLGD
ncbi:PAS domain-containing protein [Aquabacterium sp.]|uniref:PAS domain-containing protein n=1 Tax=Aquabacterium sp. TaxID=1872578 RepID=UPI002BD4BC97|nr:PAS domain-containing protein [Aquabacterium sp.]HSW03787.1 PAS domain-containing protein [Aquabacterium sp.]